MSNLSSVLDLLQQSSLSDSQLQQALALLAPFPPFNCLSPAQQLSLVPFVRPHDYTEGQTVACDFDHWAVAIVAKGHITAISGTMHLLEKQRTVRRRSKSHVSLLLNAKKAGDTILSPGDDLITQLSTTKTAVCLDSVGILVILKRDYTTILAHQECKYSTEKVNFLLSVPAFAMWTQTSLARYLDLFEPRGYVKGDVVYREGEQAVKVYIVREGEFKFVKRLEQGVGKRKSMSLQSSPIKIRAPEVQLLLKSSREIFGDMEVLEDIPHVHTCVCVSPSAQVYVVSKYVLPT